MFVLLNQLNHIINRATRNRQANAKKYSLDDFHTVWECITEACHLLSKDSRQILLKWLIEFGVQIHASQASELLDMAA